MEVAAEVAELDQLGQLARPRGLELARVLAQLRRDELVAQELVQLFLGRGREHVACLGVLHAVFRYGEAALDRLLT